METSNFRVQGEELVSAAVRIDDAWELVEKFSHLIRDSGSADEGLAVDYISGRLRAWGIEHRIHHPELLISLPRRASLTVGSVTYMAKTPSMAMSTPAGGVEAEVLYEPTGFAKSVLDIFAPAVRGTADVRGKLVLCEGQPMGERSPSSKPEVLPAPSSSLRARIFTKESSRRSGVLQTSPAINANPGFRWSA